MKFYTYLPDKNGKEPMGTENRLLFELKTIKGAAERCRRIFKTNNFKLFSYTNFYDNESFIEYVYLRRNS